MTQEERYKLFRQIMWDHNISRKFVKKLRSKSLQTKYEFVQKRLQQITIDISKTIVSDDFARFLIEEDKLFLKQ